MPRRAVDRQPPAEAAPVAQRGRRGAPAVIAHVQAQHRVGRAVHGDN
jgi:hypothetical protein